MGRKATLNDADKVFIIENISLSANDLSKKIKKPVLLIQEYLDKITALRLEAENEEKIVKAINENKKPIQYSGSTTMTDTASSQPIRSEKRDKPWIYRHD